MEFTPQDPVDPGQAPGIAGPEIPSQPEERTWAMAAHLSAFAGHFIPFGHIIGPLVIWLVKRESSPLVNDQGKEALNAQISATIYALGAIMLSFLLVGIPLLIALYIAEIVLVIVAAIAAYDGKCYRYPWILRLVK